MAVGASASHGVSGIQMRPSRYSASSTLHRAWTSGSKWAERQWRAFGTNILNTRVGLSLPGSNGKVVLTFERDEVMEEEIAKKKRMSGWGKKRQQEVKKEERIKKTQWPESASELYRPSDRRLLPKLAPTFADRGCHVVSVTDPYGSILGFLDRSRYFFFQVASQLYSRVWVDTVPDSPLLRKSGSAGNRSPGPVARNSHR
jgi:hypothetical protein